MAHMVKESTCNVGDLGSIPGLGRCPREGKGYPLLYSGLENSMDCIVHGVTKSQTRLSVFFTFTVFQALWAQRCLVTSLKSHNVMKATSKWICQD